jgi:hypothetical protein
VAETPPSLRYALRSATLSFSSLGDEEESWDDTFSIVNDDAFF